MQSGIFFQAPNELADIMPYEMSVWTNHKDELAILAQLI